MTGPVKIVKLVTLASWLCGHRAGPELGSSTRKAAIGNNYLSTGVVQGVIHEKKGSIVDRNSVPSDN